MARRAPTRRRKAAGYNSFKLAKRIRHSIEVPSSYRLLRQSLRLLLDHKRLFGGMLVIYGLLYILFVQGIGGNAFSVQELKDVINEVNGGGSSVVTALTLFGALMLTGSSAPDEVSATYQLILFTVMSLAVIWAIRQLHDNKNAAITVKDTFYKGMAQLIPTLLVVATMLLQLLPALAGITLYNIAERASLTTTGFSAAVWLMLAAALTLLSFYMLTSSVIALYIVTLPNMTPLMALKNARKLVLHHRLVIARRLLMMLILLLLLAAVVLVPLILWLEFLVQPLYFVASLATLFIVHTYLYKLYRSLL